MCVFGLNSALPAHTVQSLGRQMCRAGLRDDMGTNNGNEHRHQDLSQGDKIWVTLNSRSRGHGCPPFSSQVGSISQSRLVRGRDRGQDNHDGPSSQWLARSLVPDWRTEFRADQRRREGWDGIRPCLVPFLARPDGSLDEKETTMLQGTQSSSAARMVKTSRATPSSAQVCALRKPQATR